MSNLRTCHPCIIRDQVKLILISPAWNLLAGLLIFSGPGLAVAAQSSNHSAISASAAAPPMESLAQRNARMAWWREARLGMFIHWGLYSIPAGEWQGRPLPGNGEWIMNEARIPVADYAALTKRFNPVKFDAETWVQVAKEAGMKYLVITAKHHDGFAMFNSAASTYNIVAATPFKRDPLKELAAACVRQGLKLGFYYSQSQDWHHRGGAGNFWDSSQAGDYDQYLETVAVPQVKELLSHYGPVAVLWYDTPRHMTMDRAEKFLPLHVMQPGLIFNNRLLTADPTGGTMLGDTETPEQFIPPNGYPGKDWETCMTMNDTWGFKKNDQNWKSADDLIRKLSDIASKEGNFLLNVGPTALGEIPTASVERLQALGVWLKTNGEAIYDTQAGPLTCRLAWGRTTQKHHADGGSTLYLHVWNWPANGTIVLPGLHDQSLSGRMLADATRIIVTDSPAGLMVHLPARPTDTPIAVAALEFQGPVTTRATITTVGADGRILLTAADAGLSGEGEDKPTITGTGEMAVLNARSHWTAQYSFTTPAEQLWTITAEVSPDAYNRLTVSASGPFGRSMTTAVQAWGRGLGSFATIDLGIIRLAAGVNALVLKSEMDDLRPLELRRVWLSPLK